MHGSSPGINIMPRLHNAWLRNPYAIALAVFALTLVYYLSSGLSGDSGIDSLPEVFPAPSRHFSPAELLSPASPNKKKPNDHVIEKLAPRPDSQEQQAPPVSAGIANTFAEMPIPPTPPARLKHVLFIASHFNEDFCKGVATSLILDFPGPVVVGSLQKRPPANDSKHSELEQAVARLDSVFKTRTVLEYLESLPASAQDDLALSMDAYDTWLMLRPEVVEARYHSILQDHDARLAERKILAVDNNGTAIKSRIVFGADQSCWPAQTQDHRSCAFPPMSPLHDSGALAPPVLGMPSNARWLNAGVFMGPVRDLKRLLQSTIALMEHGYHPAFKHRWDDQGAYGAIFGEQEFARSTLADDAAADPNATLGQDAAQFLVRNGLVEHGITIDYDNRLVQNAHGSLNYLSWRQFGPSEQGVKVIEESRAPFAEFGLGHQQTWADMDTGINTGTHSVFPVFHMTVHKELRRDVWPRHWIHTHGDVRRLLRQAKSKVIIWSPHEGLTEQLDWEEACAWAEPGLFGELSTEFESVEST